MSDNIKIENSNEDENFLFGKNKEVPFITPANYFDSLADRIINKIEALEELNEFSVLASISKQTSFTVPENYFSKVNDELECKEELAAYSLLSKIPKPDLKPLSVEYLDSLTEKVVNKVQIADEIRDFATLHSFDKQNNFVINADYFDSIADRIKERIHTKPSSDKVSVIEEILFTIFKPKFAIAAGIVVIIGISSIIYFNNKTTLTDGDCKTLACLEKREMLNEHTIREMDDDNLIDMVDVDKLEKQIDKGNAADSVAVNKKEKLENK